jgi:hypothetical protein
MLYGQPASLPTWVLISFGMGAPNMTRLLARLVPPVLMMALVVGLWYLVAKLSIARAVEVLARF